MCEEKVALKGTNEGLVFIRKKGKNVPYEGPRRVCSNLRNVHILRQPLSAWWFRCSCLCHVKATYIS